MNEKALRYNKGKLKWSLVHYKSLAPMVRVLEFGALKYAPEKLEETNGFKRTIGINTTTCCSSNGWRRIWFRKCNKSYGAYYV